MQLVQIHLECGSMEARILHARIQSDGFDVELVALDNPTGAFIGQEDCHLLAKAEDEAEIRKLIDLGFA